MTPALTGVHHAPPAESELWRSWISYRLPGESSFNDITGYVLRWITIEDIEKPISIAKINVSPSFLTDDLDSTILDGSEILIHTGNPSPENLWFSGIKTDLEQDGVTGIIYCTGKGVQLEKREVTKDFIYHREPVYSGKLVDIAKYIINNYTSLDSQGIQYDSAKITEKIICDHEPVIDVLNRIRETLQWEHYERNGIYYLHPPYYIDNGVTLTVGEELIAYGDWSRDFTHLVNKLTVFGAAESHSTQEIFSGDGTGNQEFELTYPDFSDVKVEIDIAGTWTEKIGAIPGASIGNYDYTAHPEPSRKMIRFDGNTGYKPPNAADNVLITYTHAWQVPYTVQNDTSMEKYELFESTLYRSDLKTKEDIIDFAKNYLAGYGNPFKIGTVVCRKNDLRVGERVTIVDERNNINEKFTITGMEMQWPGYLCTLDVGNQPRDLGDWRRGVDERIRRLEEDKRGYASALRQEWMYDFDITIHAAISYFKLETSSKGSNFLLGSSSQDVLGAGGTGTPLGDTEKTVVIEEEF